MPTTAGNRVCSVRPLRVLRTLRVSAQTGPECVPRQCLINEERSKGTRDMKQNCIWTAVLFAVLLTIAAVHKTAFTSMHGCFRAEKTCVPHWSLRTCSWQRIPHLAHRSSFLNQYSYCAERSLARRNLFPAFEC